MIVKSKWMMSKFVAYVLFVCGLSVHPAVAAPQHPAHPSSQTFPAACYFFAPSKDDHSINKEETAKERDYIKSIAEVYRLWCKPNASTLQMKKKAADAMATSWKLLWDEDPPYNAVFHETGAFDLLVLMGITHQLPTPMVDDPKFTQMWIGDCRESCFTIWGVPEDASAEHGLAMEFRLRNEVLDNLKKEPASEPVIQMLWDARFRLVD
ncbi:MAG: hypothetical protein ABSB30_10190 [Terracidiphilus sp.]